MKTLKLTEYTSVEVPTKRSEWQLYKQAGSYKSAVKLTAALTKACRKATNENRKGTLRARGEFNGHVAESLYEQYVWPVACKCEAGGATDTEPRQVALMLLDKVVEQLIGY